MDLIRELRETEQQMKVKYVYVLLQKVYFIDPIGKYIQLCTYELCSNTRRSMHEILLMCFSVHMLLWFHILYPSHWIKDARDKFEHSKVTLEEKIAARDKQVRELTTELALRNGDLDKKEVRRELLCYNENCHESCRA